MSDQTVSRKGEVFQFSRDRRRTPVARSFIPEKGGDVIALVAHRGRVERDPPLYYKEQARRCVESLKADFNAIAYLIEEAIADVLHREVLGHIEAKSLVGYIEQRLVSCRFDTALDADCKKAKTVYDAYKTEDLLDVIRGADDRLANFRRYMTLCAEYQFTRPGEERVHFFQSEKWLQGYEPVLVLVYLAVEPQIGARGKNPRQSGN